MPITLQFVQEDGTGKSTATSYMAVADFQQYWMNRGIDYTTIPAESATKALLNEATAYIDRMYRFLGTPTTDTQALQFPRAGLTTKNGHVYDEDEMPTELLNACAEIARYLYIQGQGALDVIVGDNVRSKTVGPVSVSYGTGGKKETHVMAAERWLSNLIDPRPQTIRV